MEWFALGFIVGVFFARQLMTYRWAWRQCCLRHYQSDEHKGKGE